MNEKTESVFRKSVADYVRELRAGGLKTKTQISPFIVAFCRGWVALSDAIDVVNEKYEN